VLCLIFSLLFTNGVSRVYAAAIPVVAPTAWTLIESLFASIGLVIVFPTSLSDEDRHQAIVDHASEGYEKAIAAGSANADIWENILDLFTNIVDYVTTGGDALVLPESVWQSFVGYADVVVQEQVYFPVDDIPVLTADNKTAFKKYLAAEYGVSASNSKLTTFVNNIYSVAFDYGGSGIVTKYFDSDGDTVLTYTDIDPASISDYRFRRVNDGLSCAFSSGSFSVNSLYYFQYRAYNSSWLTGTSSSYGILDNAKCDVLAVWINGIPYNFNEIWKSPTVDEPGVIDYGNTVTLGQFDLNIDIDLGSDVVIGLEDDAASAVGAGTIDILTPGRDIDDEGAIVGNVSIPIPSDTLLDKYYNGEITWQELMDAVGVVPVDTATDTTIATGEAVEKVYIEKFQSLEGAVKSLPEVLLEGLLGLFVPSDGFWQQWFDRLLQFFEAKLGLLYTPIDILIDFLNKILTSEPQEAYLTFPGIYINFQGSDYCLAEPQDVNLNMSHYFEGLQEMIHFVTSIMMIGWVIHLGQNKLQEMMAQ